MQMNRRDFVLTTGASIVTFVAKSSDCNATTKSTALRMRPNIASLNPNDRIIRALKSGVAAMKALPPVQKTSWQFQASIHQNACTHANWYFLPWHRAYLLCFEEICRAAANDPQFVLPYWDWTKNPRLPAVFWETGSPLNHANRDVTPNEPADPEFVGTDAVENILRTQSFLTFAGGVTTAARPRDSVAAGILEAGPHNYIHRFVGGDMATFMSPLDPIFWLHHANVDRLWSEWGGQPTNDPRFLAGGFTFFSPNGNEVSKKVSDLLNHRTLGYRYEGQPEQIFFTTMAKPVTESVTSALQVGANLTTSITAGNAQSAMALTSPEFRAQIAQLEPSKMDEPQPNLRLTLEGVETNNQDVAVRVFLNCKDVNERTPIDTANYVGTFTFFAHGAKEGLGGHGDHAETAYYLNATRAVQKLQAIGAYKPDEPLKVSLVAVPLARAKDKKFEVKAKSFKIDAFK